MELLGIVNKQEYKLKVERKDERVFQVEIDGKKYEVDVIEKFADHYSVLDGERSYDVRVHRRPNSRVIETHFFDESHDVEIADPLAVLLEQNKTATKGGDAVLEAHMPGKVQRILVKEGDEVVEEQGLLVLIAMKMENELGSPKTGKIKKVMVKEGDNVEGGQALLVVG